MSTILHDLRLAARRLAQTPGFTAVAILTLALGIGAHTAIFGLIDALFLRPLPVVEPDRLVGVYETRDGDGFYPLSLPDFREHRERTEVFSELVAQYPVAPLVLTSEAATAPGAPGTGSHEEILGSVVSADYFSVLGVEPARGRFFLPEEGGTPGAHPVAVISERFRRDRLDGREDVLGTVVELNGTDFTVVGVAPESFAGVLLGFPVEVWIPTSMARVGYRWCEPSDRDCTWLHMIGRLAPGRTIAEARAEMTLLGRRTAGEHAQASEMRRGLTVAPLAGVHPSARPRTLRLAGLLLAAVTLVLLVAAANLGGLLVARGLTRRREIATRLALGAPRWRVVRVSLAETALLAGGGGAAGLLVAAWLGRLVSLLYPSEAPPDPGAALGVSPAVFGYALALSAATGLLVGLVTGVQASRPDLVPALRSETTTGGARRPSLLGTLIVLQVALSFVLLTSTGLLARSLAGADRFGELEPERVATLRLRHRLVGRGPERARPLTREAVRRLEAVPGVESVTLGRLLPPWPGVDTPAHPTEASGTVETIEVGPGFFETFGFPLLRGRSFDTRDDVGGAPVAVINRTLAERRWPDGGALDRTGERALDRALGQTLRIGDRRVRVVGVVEDRAVRSTGQASPALAYTPYWQDPDLVDARVAVRTAGDATDLLPVLAREIAAVDSAMPVTEAETLAGRIDRLLGPVRLAYRVLGASGALALLLSAVGLAGVLSLAVAQRRRDIGVRMALGGTRLRVVALVVRDALLLVGVALGLGFGAAVLAGRGLVHYLYGVAPHDPTTFAVALAVFALVSAAASWWPARRAAGVDPARILRE
jgi:predicted permease